MTSLSSCRQTSWQLPGDWKLYEPWFSSGRPVSKQPMLVMALAGFVTVGVVMGSLMVGVPVWAEAMAIMEAAARAEANVKETMVVDW